MPSCSRVVSFRCMIKKPVSQNRSESASGAAEPGPGPYADHAEAWPPPHGKCQGGSISRRPTFGVHIHVDFDMDMAGLVERLAGLAGLTAAVEKPGEVLSSGQPGKASSSEQPGEASSSGPGRGIVFRIVFQDSGPAIVCRETAQTDEAAQ